MTDLKDQVFGSLIVRRMSEDRDNQGNTVWLCDCKCGNKDIPVRSHHLISGNTTSCGCLLSTRYRNFHKNRERNIREAHTDLVTLEKECPCGDDFKVIYPEKDCIKKRAAETRKLCDKCKIKKSVGTRFSKDDW